MINPDEFDAHLTSEHRKRMERRFMEIYGSDSETDLTPEERLSFQKEFENLHDAFQKIGHGLHVEIQDKVSDLAGMHMTVMLHSLEEAEQYLESSEASLRLAALYVLYHHWGQTDAYANRYERIAMCDSNAEVRMLSLSFFGSCFSYTGDTRVSRMLASVVLDANEPENIRMAAYGSILRVHGYPKYGFSFREPARAGETANHNPPRRLSCARDHLRCIYLPLIYPNFLHRPHLLLCLKRADEGASSR